MFNINLIVNVKNIEAIFKIFVPQFAFMLLHFLKNRAV